MLERRGTTLSHSEQGSKTRQRLRYFLRIAEGTIGHSRAFFIGKNLRARHSEQRSLPRESLFESKTKSKIFRGETYQRLRYFLRIAEGTIGHCQGISFFKVFKFSSQDQTKAMVTNFYIDYSCTYKYS